MKSGGRTTEFWALMVTIASLLGGAVWMIAAGRPEMIVYIGYALGGLTAVYTIARTWLKLEETKVIDLLSQDREERLKQWVTVLDAFLQKAKETKPDEEQ